MKRTTANDLISQLTFSIFSRLGRDAENRDTSRGKTGNVNGTPSAVSANKDDKDNDKDDDQGDATSDQDDDLDSVIGPSGVTTGGVSGNARAIVISHAHAHALGSNTKNVTQARETQHFLSPSAATSSSSATASSPSSIQILSNQTSPNDADNDNDNYDENQPFTPTKYLGNGRTHNFNTPSSQHVESPSRTPSSDSFSKLGDRGCDRRPLLNQTSSASSSSSSTPSVSRTNSPPLRPPPPPPCRDRFELPPAVCRTLSFDPPAKPPPIRPPT